MTPGAQVEAAIGLLDDIDAARAPADDIVANYFRRHRFAGVKDRAGISRHIYAVLRHRAMLDWWLEKVAPDLPKDGRRRLLAALIRFEEWSPQDVHAACDGDRFRPTRLSLAEEQFVAELARSDSGKDMPPDVRGNYPAWLSPYLERALGKDVGREMAAMTREAPLDLRVNTLKSDREKARAALAREGVEAGRTPLSPLGLRLFERVPLGTLDSFRQGLIEVQDEGSQLAALLADARPGMRVVDFCAGAGGKTLALAAAMGNRGHLVACDIAALRLERATQRLRRAGASIVQRKALTSARDKWVKRHAGSFDRVFVDAPCTGTGTWRRNPDAKWRLKPEDIAELTALQADILDSAARLVKPGGRLIYATCSLLREEDEDQIERFLASHLGMKLVPVPQIWHDVIGGEAPGRAEMLRLSPGRHGTDGFFAAILEAPPAPKPPPESSAGFEVDQSAGQSDPVIK